MLKTLGGLIAVFVLVVTVGLGWLVHDGRRTPVGSSEYVALGSSFAAGPGVVAPDPNAPVLCNRSIANYAHLLAAKRRLDLTDMTCSGATAVNVLRGGQYFQGPQIDALRPETRLVTVTVGGNDISYVGNLFAWSCQAKPDAIGWIWRRLICAPASQETVQKEIDGLRDTMLKITAEVRRRSPQAQLVFVDYATILPEAGQCPDRLPVTPEELDRSRLISRKLGAITADVARQSDAMLVRASVTTEGHDICSVDPWVFGWTMPPSPLNFGPMGFHPTYKAMNAIADAIDRDLN